LRFDPVAPDVDERPRPGETAVALVRRLALAKARAVSARFADESTLPVLAADTVVSVDDRVLGKPRDREHALAMLARLSGRWHEVLTAVAVVAPAAELDCLTRTGVLFRTLSPHEARAYWATG